MKSTRILGIDPGTIALGWGIIDTNGQENHLLEFGVVRTTPKAPLQNRLLTIFDALTEIIDRFHPNVMAVEEVFLGKNPRSALWIGYARAMAMLAAVKQDVSLAEYANRQVKMSVVGNGSAYKKQVEFMVSTILETDARIPQDAADALAVALCHASRCTDFHSIHDQ